MLFARAAAVAALAGLLPPAARAERPAQIGELQPRVLELTARGHSVRKGRHKSARGGTGEGLAEAGALTPNDTDKVTVYFVHGFFGNMSRREMTAEECEIPCVQEAYPSSKDVAERADLLVTFPIGPEPPRNARGAAALALSMEATGLYGSEFAGRYDGIANTSLLSTVPWPYFGLPEWRRIQQRSRGPSAQKEFPGFKERLPAAVFVAKNCEGESRNLLIEELVRRGVPIHSISDCHPAGTEHAWPAGEHRSDKLGALRRYRVYLALENTPQLSYVTEKAIHGFAAGAVPLYLGAPDVGDYLPRSGYISATEAVQEPDLEARSHKLDALADQVMAAIGDEATWKRYLAWRHLPLEQLNGGELARRWAWTDGVHRICRLCRFAYAQLTPGASWDQERQQVVGGEPPPARGRKATWAVWRLKSGRGQK